MTYTETLDKIEAHGTLTREEALTLVFNAEANGEQSWKGVAVVATEVPDSLNYTYEISVEV